MGADSSPATMMAGVASARRRHPNVRFLLHGDENTLKPLLKRNRALARCAEIRHSPDVVSMASKPSQAIRRGRESSMWHAVGSVADGDADVAVSAGNTGALMAMSMFRIRVAEGISRPAIAVIWPIVVMVIGLSIPSDPEQRHTDVNSFLSFRINSVASTDLDGNATNEGELLLSGRGDLRLNNTDSRLGWYISGAISEVLLLIFLYGLLTMRKLFAALLEGSTFTQGNAERISKIGYVCTDVA